VQRLLFASTLREAGYDVVEASTGSEAWELLCEGGYAVVVLDQRMPGMTGVEVLERLRREGMSVPVLMVSGFDTESGLSDLLRDVTILSKPLRPKALLQHVQAAISG
jgi:two-component system NtrC family response regulator